MTFELVAILIAGFGGAGVGLFMIRVLRLPLPRWFAPALAGCCMIAMSIWSEYNWFPRLKAGIPPGVVLADTGETATAYRPWTHVFPLVTEAFLVDTRRWERNPQAPDLVLAQVFRFARWQGNQDMLVMFDCAQARRVDVTASVTFSDTGEMSGGTWVPLDPADPILKAACHGG